MAIPPLASPAWWFENVQALFWAGVWLVGLIVALFLASLIPAWIILRRVGLTFAGVLLQLVPTLIVLLTLVWLASLGFVLGTLGYLASDITYVVPGPIVDWVQSLSTDLIYWALLVLVALPYILWIPLYLAPSAHDQYRRLLRKCFAVGRTDEETAAVADGRLDIAMSSLLPADRMVPQILICAAANVSDSGAAMAGINALPLVFSPTTVSIPVHDGASYPTVALERSRGWSEKGEPFASRASLGLTSAVAITGAAVSPSMGRFTAPHLRPALAALGVRLGRWVPNPSSALVRNNAAALKLSLSRNDILRVLQEFFGRHDSKSRSVYASDGGHFENMGLVELLRRRCDTIWLVDASPQRQGYPLALTQSLLLAEAESSTRIVVSMESLGEKAGPNTFVSVCASGTATYDDGHVTALHVVKLGLTADHSSILRNYARVDQGFPFHPTIQQIYNAERFEAYRRLGWESSHQLFASIAPVGRVRWPRRRWPFSRRDS